MKVLITGMSGTGKSTIVAMLTKRGYRAIDLDTDGWSGWSHCDGNPTGANPGHDWIWNEARLSGLLDEETQEPLFLSGCAPNMGRFTARFDRIVLLSASADILLERVAVRGKNPYGKTPAEATRIVENLRDVEPALRRVATHEIDASQPLEKVIEGVVRVAR
ncbi:MAG: AAA family ATPase [Rhodospirillales bacterium]|nr:AAA family ATPase [Rhodospirillales bacterium]